MIELKQKRTYTAKHFQKEDGSFVMRAHIGHVHYYNRLGVGDGVKGFREIDWTLQWDEERRGWYFQFHNFHPFLPEYSDGWVEFRDVFEDKDQTIRYKAVCNRVKGRLVKAEELEKEGLKDLTGVNCVIYDDAFGKGFDYILYFTRHCLVKAVRIRDGYKPKSDISFEWQVDFPKDPKTLSPLPIFRTEKKEDLTDELKTLKKTLIKEGEKTKAYLLDYTSPKEFDTRKQTLIGQDKLDGKEWFTYLRPFRVWDSGEHKQEEIVKTEIYPKNGKLFLRKTVTADFLAKSVGDVFTDTTTSYNPTVGDGVVRYMSASSWSTLHSATDGTDVYYDATRLYGSYDKGSGSLYNISRMFIPFDTSSLPTGSTIAAASLHLYTLYFNNQTNKPASNYLVVVQTSQPDTSQLTEADWDLCGAVDNFIEGSDHIEIWNMSLNNWFTWTLNNTGIGWINAGGITKLGLRCSVDSTGTDPGWIANTGSDLHFAASENGSNIPYLEITYTEGGSESPSISPSSSESPSISPSSSESPSISPSSSESPSISPSSSESPSISPSASISPSSSESPSISPSSSESPSISPSPSLGTKDYTRGSYDTLPTNDNDLSIAYTDTEKNNVAAEDGVYVNQDADTNYYAIHQFKDTGSGVSATLTWKGKSSVAPSSSIVKLQIYNRNTSSWEDVDSDNTTAADTQFTLTGTISDLTNYQDVNGTITCRVYQQNS